MPKSRIYISDTARLQRVTARGRLSEPNAVAFLVLVYTLLVLDRAGARLVCSHLIKYTEVDLVACNGRTFVMEPEWTRIRPGLKQKSIIDYIIITDMQMLKKSGKLCVDTTDIGISDHFLLWLELGRHTKGKRVMKK